MNRISLRIANLHKMNAVNEIILLLKHFDICRKSRSLVLLHTVLHISAQVIFLTDALLLISCPNFGQEIKVIGISP